MLTTCDDALLSLVTAGTLMKCSLKSTDAFITCGARLIRMEMFLDILVQSKRDKKAAKKFFRKLLKGLRYVPSVIITDKLRSYNAAKDAVLPSVEHQNTSMGTTVRKIHISQRDCESV
jgi:CRISPR/Cas system-associated protein endoribonuclease Cas2